MTFTEYWSRLSADEKKLLAQKLGMNYNYVCDVANGRKRVSRYFALAIERFSRGVVKHKEVRPDIPW